MSSSNALSEWEKIESAYYYKRFAVLKLYVKESNTELVELYREHVAKHNATLLKEELPNSGFDIFIPSEVEFNKDKEKDGVPRTMIMNPNRENPVNSKMIDMEIKAEMVLGSDYRKSNESSSPYFVFPRSSISKTPLMLANHTGVIDANYRGFLIGAFRNLDAKDFYKVEKHTRLLQICHPSLCPIYVVLVQESELSTTARGSGGFGSTGLVGL